MCQRMSDNINPNAGGKSPLLNIAASIVATITCCNTDTKEQNTTIDHNNILGPADTELGQKSDSFYISRVARPSG